MRISDWSSDVCSSDLLPPPVFSLHAPTGDAFDFEPLLTEALAPLRRRATIKRIALRCTVPAGLPRLCADRPAVLRRIRHLLRPEERRGGKKSVSRRRSRWTPSPQKKNNPNQEK